MEEELKSFTHFLSEEKGLAVNTVVSYERDLKSYIKYLKNVEQIKAFNDVQRIYITQFLSYLKEQGKSSRTTSKTYCLHKSSASVLTS